MATGNGSSPEAPVTRPGGLVRLVKERSTSLRTQVRAGVVAEMWKGVQTKYQHEQPRVVGVGGSVGKTSTKEAISLLLKESGKEVTATVGNLATDTGMALSLLGFTSPPNGVLEWWRVLRRAQHPSLRAPGGYYVLEYSSDTVGDTKFLTDRIAPHIAVLATIVPVHMASYGTEEAMVEETVSLVDAVGEGGIVVANADDPQQKTALKQKKLRDRTVLWYGLAKNSIPNRFGVWGSNLEMTNRGLRLTISFIATGGVDALTQQSHRITVQSTVLAPYQLYPLLAAAAVGWAEQLSPRALKRALEHYTVPNGRGRLIAGRKGVTIIDDTANAAAAEAVMAGLTMLTAYAGERRRVAILGTMNELGSYSEQAHRLVAKTAAEQADFLVAVGKYGELMVAEARKAGMPSIATVAFATPEQLLSQLEQVIKAKDVVYVKASQNGMFLERVVKELMAKPEQAGELLVRQGLFWDRKRT